MCRHIEFHAEYCNDIPFGKNILTEDESIIFEPSFPICSFSIHPYDWSFELTTQKESENKYLICYALANLCFFKCKQTDLTIPKAQRGKIFALLNFQGTDGIYYSDYAQFTCAKYYDPQNNILAIGDITATGRTIEFANNQFAVIDELGRLIAVYISLNQ